MLPDLTAAGFTARRRRRRRWLERFDGVARRAGPGLTPEQRIDLALLRAHLGQQVATADFAAWRRYAHDVPGERRVRALRARHPRRGRRGRGGRAAHGPGARPPWRPGARTSIRRWSTPSCVRQWAIPNAAAQASFMREGLAGFVTDPVRRAELEQAGAAAATAYDEYVDYLGDLAERATGSFVFGEERLRRRAADRGGVRVRGAGRCARWAGNRWSRSRRAWRRWPRRSTGPRTGRR